MIYTPPYLLLAEIFFLCRGMRDGSCFLLAYLGLQNQGEALTPAIIGCADNNPWKLERQ